MRLFQPRFARGLFFNLGHDERMAFEIGRHGLALGLLWWIPAVTLAKQIIDSGKLGKIFHYRANFLQDWTISADLPQGGAAVWRLDAAAAGSGVTGDLLAHCIDTALWLNGGISTVWVSGTGSPSTNSQSGS